MVKSRDVRSIQTKLIRASECISEVFVRYEKLSKENKQLKCLLEECRGFIRRENECNYSPLAYKLLTKIEEVIK